MKLRYLGNKRKMLKNIEAVLRKHVDGSEKIFVDAFAGSNSVGQYFKPHYQIISNDLMYMSQVLAKAIIENNHVPSFTKLNRTFIHNRVSHLTNNGLKNVLLYLNYYDLSEYNGGFITKNYSPAGKDKRMYFTIQNAKRIDFIRHTLNVWKHKYLISNSEFYYLLASLLLASSKIANITGTYGAYLKHWDTNSKNLLKLHTLPVYDNHRHNKSYRMDANKLVHDIHGDILYIDTPYNSRGYDKNYFLPEIIAGGKPIGIHGKTGLPDKDNEKSAFTRKRKAYSAMKDLLTGLHFKHVLISYSTDGIIDYRKLFNLVKSLAKHGTAKLYKFNYQEFQSKQKGKEKKHQLYELIYYFQPK